MTFERFIMRPPFHRPPTVIVEFMRMSMLLFYMAQTEIKAFETTAGQVADTLARLGVPSDRHLTIVIEPDDWLAKARQESRRRVLAAGLSDEDVDRLIERAREEVQPAR